MAVDVNMKLVGSERIRPLMDTRRLRQQIDLVAADLDKVQDLPDQAEPQEWQEEQPSSSLEAELLKCKQLRQELRSLKRRRK